MLIDTSGRIWAMRRDDMMIAQTVAVRERAGSGQLPAMTGLPDVAPLEGSDFAYRAGSVAVVPVLGMLLRRMNWMTWSYDEVVRDLRLAEADSRVEAIVLDIDSPGGLVAGCGDAARVIREEIGKPVEAFIGGMGASAAYYLASAADRIVLGSGAYVGSIGTVIEYVDIEPMLEAAGARMIRVVAQQSPNKRLDPASPDGRAEMQSLVDAGAAEFIADVARYRGVTEQIVMERYGQGLVFGGGEAIARGMADARGTLDTLIAGLAARDTWTAVAAPAATETSMDWNDLTLAGLREHRADLAEAIEADATTAARAASDSAVAEALTAERARIAQIDEIAVPGHAALVKKAKSEGWEPGRLAMEIVKADKAAGGRHLQDLAAADQQTAVPPVPPADTTATGGQTADERLEQSWFGDAELRAEFRDNKAAFLAYAKRDKAGRTRFLADAA